MFFPETNPDLLVAPVALEEPPTPRVPFLVFTAESESVKVERFKHPFTSGNPIDELKYVENKMKHLF